MSIKKLATAVAVTAALGGGAGVASAGITGIPGEAALVPMVLSGEPDYGPGVLESYVGLYVPTNIGKDTIINNFSAPHAAPGPVVQDPVVAEIHWTYYDHKSRKVQDGTCEVSPGDYVLWTTDFNVQDAQAEQRQDLVDDGIFGRPDPTCGPSRVTRIGYVVFQTVLGADGQAADFAFWSAASVYGNGNQGLGHFGVPVMPMADGADPLPAGSGEPQLTNEVIAGGVYNDGQTADPVAVAPILAGVRMNNADGDGDDFVYVQAPIQGPQAFARSLHVFWFDSNDPQRVAATKIWDDMEGECSDSVPLPYELNLYMYNQFTQVPNNFNVPPSWNNLLNGTIEVNRVTSVVDAIYLDPQSNQGYQSPEYCYPDYWDLDDLQALGGYVEYEIPEIGEPAAVGFVNSAAVAFNVQEYVNQGGWASHMSADLGKRP